MLNVAVLNGGRGAATLIKALLARQGLHVTSLVNAYDDGKSTGEIRRRFGMLGPSDIRKVQELMLPEDDPDFRANLALFRFRFPVGCRHEVAVAEIAAFVDGRSEELCGARFESRKVRVSLQSVLREFLATLEPIERVFGAPFGFSDCALMNIVYAGAFLLFRRDLEQATLFIDRLFKLRGTVLPSSVEDKKLMALRENGQVLYSEAEIVELRSNVRIENVYLVDNYVDREKLDPLDVAEKRSFLERHHCPVHVSPGVELTLRQADIIIYAAGTQHSSLYPTYMSTGLARTISHNKTALKVFVTNIGADYETPNYRASDYVRGAYRYLNSAEPRAIPMQDLIDVILVNQSQRKSSETYVQYDEAGYADVPVRRIVDAFESISSPGRHDGAKLANAILALYEQSSAITMRSQVRRPACERYALASAL
jgi:2-phospho-L-lactate transferase/gluconeogenesis factor (CofD/UPF0052 family)